MVDATANVSNIFCYSSGVDLPYLLFPSLSQTLSQAHDSGIDQQLKLWLCSFIVCKLDCRGTVFFWWYLVWLQVCALGFNGSGDSRTQSVGMLFVYRRLRQLLFSIRCHISIIVNSSRRHSDSV